MLFGFTVTVEALIPGGVVLIALLAFQILVGKRVIRFKGRTHMRVHRWAAYTMGLVALGHGLMGLILGLHLTIG